jgi:hypothetical protein
MIVGIRAKAWPPADRLTAYRATGVIARVLVAPGAVLVLLSGIALSMPYMQSGAVPGWLMAMQGTGLLGALIVIFVVTPTAARLSRLELLNGGLPASFAELRKRLVIFATAAGILGLAAMVSGTLFR